MYLEEVEAVVETRTVDKCLLRRKNLLNLHKKYQRYVFKAIKRTYLRSYYTKRSM